MTVQPETVVAPDMMNATDRCDRCGAQAYVAATKDGMMLIFCKHHGAEQSLALVSAGFAIHDETWKLNADTSPMYL